MEFLLLFKFFPIRGYTCIKQCQWWHKASLGDGISHFIILGPYLPEENRENVLAEELSIVWVKPSVVKFVCSNVGLYRCKWESTGYGRELKNTQ